jgi:long-chain acyl-CoA synthetase
MNQDDLSKIVDSLPSNISGILDKWVNETPERTALQESSGQWSYQKLGSAVSEASQWLTGLGVRPGDRVMFVSENCRAYVALLLANARIGAWSVPVNARLSAQEIDAIRDHCGARRVIYLTSVSRQAEDHAKRHEAETVSIGLLGSIAVGKQNENAEPEPIEASPTSVVAVVIYTSGTTGLPKGVMLTHHSLLYMAAVSARIRLLTSSDRLYGVLPMTHAVGLSVVLLGALLSGAQIYLVPRFDPVAAIATLQKEEITVVLGVPSMFSVLVEYAKLKQISSLRFPALRVVSASGAPLTSTIKADTERLIGMVLNNGYGVTECSPTIAQARRDEPRSDLSVGKILPGMEAKLVDNNGNVVPAGEIGELHVRGPNIMKGYYHSPEETKLALNSDGWFNTRDLARFEDGHLFIVGRSKELIVRFGFNVYPAEIEAVLSSHPDVARAAVIGRTVEAIKGGEEVIAFVELASGSPTDPETLNEFASKKLAAYKRPSRIVILDEMPVTPTGKPMKADLAKIPLVD